MSDAVTSAEAVESLESDLVAAEQMLAGGDLGQALRMWTAIRERFPGHAAAYLRAAHALANGGEFDKAEVLLLEGQLLVQSAGPTFASEFARMAARQRDAAEAVRRWSAARTAFPRHPVGWVGGVEALREAGRINEAEALLDQLRELFPAEAAIPILAASLADAVKDWPKAVDLWAVAREQLPQNSIGFIKGAKALWQNGGLDQADALLADGINRFAGNAELVTQWAELAVHRQRWSDAAERWALLRQRHPTIPLGYVNGSTALLEAGRAAEAETLITAAIEQFPDRPDVRRQQARYAEMQSGLAREFGGARQTGGGRGSVAFGDATIPRPARPFRRVCGGRNETARLAGSAASLARCTPALSRDKGAPAQDLRGRTEGGRDNGVG
jgi:predicted Zn-dependent protease